jgi:glutamate-1-semialdehyde 2,1-aminomutase
MNPRTLYRKLVDSHTVARLDEQNVLLFCDLHLMNEYTSPQAFAGLHERGCEVLMPGQNVATVSHIIPTHDVSPRAIADPASALQAANLKRNCDRHGIALFGVDDPRQGVEHIVSPEHGMIRPGMVVICGDHPFFSTDDLFSGTTAMSAGIPATIQNLTKTFRFNDIKSLSDIFAEFPGRIACCILEAERTEPPKAGFLEGVRNLCHTNGALFVIDEMITGFRWHRGGAQAHHGIEPDLSCFGKALANGFSVSALAGKREFMRLGGLDHTDKPRVFLLSTTHGAETHALDAAIANMRVYADEPVVEHLQRQGARLRSHIDQVVARHDLQDFVRLIGRDCCLLYETRDRSGQPSQGMRTLLLQETLRRGVIMPSLVVAYTHSDSDIDKTVEALDGALAVYRRALDGRIEDYLVGRASEPVMRAYNRLPAA